jgi:hypothetical protein
MASISASVKAPGTMVSGIRNWLPVLPVKAVTSGPGPSPFEEAPSTRTEIVAALALADIDRRRLASERGGGLGVAGDHGLGFLARLLPHQVDHRAPLLAFGRGHHIKHGDPAAGPLGPAAGVAERVGHLRAFVDDHEEDALAGPVRWLGHGSSPLFLDAPHDRAAEPAGQQGQRNGAQAIEFAVLGRPARQLGAETDLADRQGP